jgi:SAM-dependent methyltransferase
MKNILEIGAGQSPDPRATETLDIRDDLDHIDYGGVDVGSDKLPLEADSVDLVVANHVVEHIPGEAISHLFMEIDRVVRSGGRFHAVTPHAGTWQAATDPTHQASGGWTPDVINYFTGELEEYFPELCWDVEARANLSFPLVLRKSCRLRFSTARGDLSHELVKLPLVSGEVEFEATIH